MTYEIQIRKDGRFDLYIIDSNGDVHSRKSYATEKSALTAAKRKV